MAVPLDVPVGYHIAIGAPLGLCASASSSPSAPHPDPPAPPAHQARRLPPTSAAAPFPQERVPCEAAEDLRGDARPLRHRGRQAAAPPIDVNAGLQRCRRPPLPVLSNAPPRACFPSSLSAALLSARSRLRGRPLGVVGLLHGRSRGAARVAPPPVELPRQWVLAPSTDLPLILSLPMGVRIRLGAMLRAPEIVPAGLS